MESPDALRATDTDPRILQISPEDNIGVAKTDLPAGESVVIGGCRVTLTAPIATGHKLALVPIAAGEKVLKYNAPIGSATRDISPGDSVHTHNVKSDYLRTFTREDDAGSSLDAG